VARAGWPLTGTFC